MSAMTKPSDPTPRELIAMLDEQLGGADDEMLARLTQQADEIHTAHGDLVVRLRRELEASWPAMTDAWHLRG